jgi:hypothetical protein
MLRTTARQLGLGGLVYARTDETAQVRRNGAGPPVDSRVDPKKGVSGQECTRRLRP